MKPRGKKLECRRRFGDNAAPMSAAAPSVQSTPVPRPASESLRLLAYPLFFASGMAGLVYEVVWTRMLLYKFGAGIYAVTAVLAAFMAGLALGSALFGRLSDRLRHPIRFYAMLEFLISIAGFALPAALGRVGALDGWAYARWGENFQILTACRFGLSFTLLLIPTTLMGATLPVLAKAMVRTRGHLGMHISELYAVNTTGAVAGAFVSGFFFIERYGVIQTEFIAAILNLAAAAGALTIAFLLDQRPIQNETIASGDSTAAETIPEAAPLNHSQIRLILFAAFATGLISLAAQVLWFRSLVFAFEYLKNTTYAFSAMLTIFLLGLAVGSAAAGTFIDRHANPMRLYGMLLLLLGVSIAFSVNTLFSGAGFIINILGKFGFASPFTEATQNLKWPIAVLHIMLQSAAVVGLPTFLMGMAFPVAVRAVVSTEQVGGHTGRLYALNTAGAIAGSIIACFFIVPLFGLSGGLMILAVADAALGAAIVLAAPQRSAVVFTFAAIEAGLIALVIFTLPKHHAMQQLNVGESIVFYKEGPLATVSVIRNQFGYDTINVDGVGVAGTEPMLQTDQKSLAHVPMMLVENPRSALTVGFGAGGASYSYLLHDRLEKIHCVEICDTVLDAAPFLKAANHDVLSINDPRYRIIHDDARTYLQYTNEKYDIIATDCTDLRYKSNANLYDLQYFQFCRDRLNPGGAVVVWMPLAGLSVDMFKVALRTLHRVFPEMAVFFMDNEPTHYVLLAGWRDKMSLTYNRMADSIAEPDVRADLGELFLDDPVKILSTFITGGDALEPYLAGDAINTENRPRLEYESPKYGYQDKPIADNLASLMAIRRSPAQWIEPGMPEAEGARLDRYEAALPHIIQGHADFRDFKIEEAAREYMAAAKETPEDKSVANLLTFRELALLAQLGSPRGWLLLGRANQVQGKDQVALNCYNRVSESLGKQGTNLTAVDEQTLRTARDWRAEIESKSLKSKP